MDDMTQPKEPASVLARAHEAFEADQAHHPDNGFDRDAAILAPSAKRLTAWADILAGDEPFSQVENIAAYLRHRASLAVQEVFDDGVLVINGERYMRDHKERLVPVEQVRVIDKLIDECVRKIVSYAKPLSAQVARFRDHSFDDVNGLRAVVAQDYGVEIGGSKGNRTLTSFDGKYQVKVQIADRITFGIELDAAKALVDECLREWTDGARAELRALVDKAFAVDKEGKLNTSELLGLRRLNITDERWLRAMQALSDSIRIVGSKAYIRVYEADERGNMKPIVIDVASS